MARPDGFICRDEYLDKLAKLSDIEVGRLFRALMKYHRDGETQELKGREDIAFDFIREDIDRADEKYQDKCEQNRANRANGRQRPSTDVNGRERTATDAPNNNVNYNKSDDDEPYYNQGAAGDGLQAVVSDALRDCYPGGVPPQWAGQIAGEAERQGLPSSMAIEAIEQAAKHGAASPAAYAMSVIRDMAEHGERSIVAYRRRIAKEGI